MPCLEHVYEYGTYMVRGHVRGGSPWPGNPTAIVYEPSGVNVKDERLTDSPTPNSTSS
jgi:hypothetical protein